MGNIQTRIILAMDLNTSTITNTKFIQGNVDSEVLEIIIEYMIIL